MSVALFAHNKHNDLLNTHATVDEHIGDDNVRMIDVVVNEAVFPLINSGIHLSNMTIYNCFLHCRYNTCPLQQLLKKK